MAERPIFVPVPAERDLVKEIYFRLTWHPGFAVVQKQKNVAALHAAAAAAGYSPLLEISTKSQEKLGQHLSAFHLKVRGRDGEIPLECAFQGSKHRVWLTRLRKYAGFTDIEFNPERSLNCQARSCALFVSLMTKDLLESAVESWETFVSIIAEHSYGPRTEDRDGQLAILAASR